MFPQRPLWPSGAEPGRGSHPAWDDGSDESPALEGSSATTRNGSSGCAMSLLKKTFLFCRHQSKARYKCPGKPLPAMGWRTGSDPACRGQGTGKLHTEGMLSPRSDLTGTCWTCQLIRIRLETMLMSKLARNTTWCLGTEPLCLAPPAALGRAQQERFLVERGGIAVEGPWSDPSHPPARGRAASSPDGLHRRTFPVLPCQRPLCRRAERQHSCLPSPAKPAPVRPSLSWRCRR